MFINKKNDVGSTLKLIIHNLELILYERQILIKERSYLASLCVPVKDFKHI